MKADDAPLRILLAPEEEDGSPEWGWLKVEDFADLTARQSEAVVVYVRSDLLDKDRGPDKPTLKGTGVRAGLGKGPEWTGSPGRHPYLPTPRNEPAPATERTALYLLAAVGMIMLLVLIVVVLLVADMAGLAKDAL